MTLLQRMGIDVSPELEALGRTIGSSKTLKDAMDDIRGGFRKRANDALVRTPEAERTARGVFWAKLQDLAASPLAWGVVAVVVGVFVWRRR